MRFRRGAIGFLAALSVMAACSRKPASIEILPKKVQIFGIDRSQRLTARVLDGKGQPVELSTPDWSSSNDGIVTAEAGGASWRKRRARRWSRPRSRSITAQVPVEVVDVSIIEVSPPALAITGPAGTAIPVSFTVKDSHGAARRDETRLELDGSEDRDHHAGRARHLRRRGHDDHHREDRRPPGRLRRHGRSAAHRAPRDPAGDGARARRRVAALRGHGLRARRRRHPRGRGRLQVLQPGRRDRRSPRESLRATRPAPRRSASSSPASTAEATLLVN